VRHDPIRRLPALRAGPPRARAALRALLALVALAGLSACIDGRDLDQPAAPLGDFKLGHNIVIAPNLQMGPLSREATQEEWIEALTQAVDDRFRRYDGDRIYHFGISIEGYVLAQVGVPLVLQPKSVVIFRLTVWDDEAGAKMTAEPKEITVLEAISAESMAGSGLTQTREEQMENLAILAAKQIEEYLVEQKREARWFRGFRPEGARPESQASVAASEAAGLATEARIVAPETLTPDTLTPETVAPEAAPGAATPGDAAPALRAAPGAAAASPVVVEPVEAVTDPVVTALPPASAMTGAETADGAAAPAN
jgi:hypothetical protein